ncbi:MAG: TonB-dependent receptor, partial [Bacteroidales bacterium]|nr:TonB-dependent receptor [Bacteroidales bacterium]
VTVVNATGEPGGASTILIRGATQISGSQDPLIILDGAILEGTLADINVNDIESIEIVKGASAAALYGSRAGNGVIAITTKRGSGLAVGKTEVLIRSEYGMNRLAKKYDLATHHGYVLADDQDQYDFTKYAGVTYPEGYQGTEAGFAGNRFLEDDQYMDNPYRKLYDHEDDIFQGNEFYTNYVSVSNNTAKTNFLTSFENTNQSGLLFETDGYKRNSFRLNVDHDLSDNITLSATNLYVNSYTQDPGGDSKYNGGIFFNVLLAEPDVNYKLKNPDDQPYLFIPNAWETTGENPLYNLWKLKDETTRSRFLGTYSAKWRLTSFFNVEAKYAFETSDRTISQYSPFDTWTRGGAGATYSEGYLSLFDSKLFSQNAQVTANLNKQLGDFNMRAKFSYLFEDFQYQTNQTIGYDFSLADVPSLDAVGGNTDITSYKEQVIAKNYFGILYLDYQDKYIFDGMVRYDGSSLFGEDARWNPYYRVSGAWRITEDIEIPGVQELKLRAAYGTAGQRPDFADQYEVMSISQGQATKSQLGNTNLKPSLSEELEAAVNIDFANRFSFELIHSKSNTSDQIMSVPLAVQFGGWPSQIQNAGSLEAKTWEASLGVQAIRTKDLTLNFNLIFDRITTKITELNVPPYQTGPQGQEANKLFYIRKGEVFGAMYGYDWVTSLAQMEDQLPEADNAATWFDESDINSYTVNSDGYVIVKGTEGTVNEKPIKVLDEEGNPLFGQIGDTNPDFKMGLATNLAYKGFSIYMLWDWKNGGDLYNKSAQWLTRDDRHGMMDQFGKPENEKKAIPYYKEFYDVNSFNKFWVEDASY